MTLSQGIGYLVGDTIRFEADHRGNNGAGEDRHYLQLDKNETALLKHICDSGKFAHVVVLFNTSNNIDAGFLKFADDYAYQSKIDAALLIGSTGGAGIMGLGDILSGKVNPSGHTVDTLYTHYENEAPIPAVTTSSTTKKASTPAIATTKPAAITTMLGMTKPSSIHSAMA